MLSQGIFVESFLLLFLEFWHTQGVNLNFEGLLMIDQTPNVSSGLKSKIQKEIGITSSEEGGTES